MNKKQTLSFFVILFLVLTLTSVTATYYNNYAITNNKYPSYKSTYNAPSTYVSYRESPGYIGYPNENFNQRINSNYYSSNQDTASYGYDYRGPLYERQITNVDDYSHIISSKSGFFTSKNKDNLRHTITYTLTEKYIGASESIFYNTQNNRFTSNVANQDTSYNSDGGFSFGKQRSFDAAEYSKDSYTSAYYYRPYYDSSKDYYNWKY